MKLFLNYGIAAVAVFTIMVTSCGGGPIEHGTEYVLQGPDGATEPDMQCVQLVLENRLTNFGLRGDFEISRDSNRIKIRVSGEAIEDDSKMRNLLQNSATLSFRAMYTFGEIASTINEAQQAYLRMNEIDSTNADGAGLYGLIEASYGYHDSPLIFSYQKEDTAEVMNILRTDSIAALFPSDVVFHWGAGIESESGEPTFGLFACKVGRNYVMSGNYVETADALLNSNNNMWEVSLAFDPVGSKEFARITKANIGRSLAIELDDFVYNYPTVNAEITGGRAVITGVFTQDEASDLAKILSAGQLPIPVVLVEENTF